MQYPNQVLLELFLQGNPISWRRENEYPIKLKGMSQRADNEEYIRKQYELSDEVFHELSLTVPQASRPALTEPIYSIGRQ